MKLGLTQTFPCSYLPDESEQLLVLVEHTPEPKVYQYLMQLGFRRSGEQVYRPHCVSCSACQSIRIPIERFVPSKSQKRVLNKNRDIEVSRSFVSTNEQFKLYERYIEERHDDGSMYPPSKEQYQGFIGASWLNPCFIEARLDGELIAVAVTDVLPESLSALYTFFKPTLDGRSLGTYLILQQIEQAKLLKRAYVYLGYQIDACQKMNYKQKFLPHERFYQDKWHLVVKNGG